MFCFYMDDHFEFFLGNRGIFTTMVAALFFMKPKSKSERSASKKPTKGYTCWTCHVENHAKTTPGVTFQPGFLKLKLLTDATEMKVRFIYWKFQYQPINKKTDTDPWCSTLPEFHQPFRSSTSKTTFQRSRNDDKNGLQTVMGQKFWGYTPGV